MVCIALLLVQTFQTFKYNFKLIEFCFEKDSRLVRNKLDTC